MFKELGRARRVLNRIVLLWCRLYTSLATVCLVKMGITNTKTIANMASFWMRKISLWKKNLNKPKTNTLHSIRICYITLPIWISIRAFTRHLICGLLVVSSSFLTKKKSTSKTSFLQMNHLRSVQAASANPHRSRAMDANEKSRVLSANLSHFKKN